MDDFDPRSGGGESHPAAFVEDLQVLLEEPPAARRRASAPAPKPKKAKPSGPTKLFVLDTNVLMHDPTSLFRFDEHDVYLPIATLEELDSHKRGLSDVSRNARQA
ncbi:MAG TPA: PIN domain-containing protein, partial [Ramlibacter sp.]|nr:PIN domain-containing protein [Ramlibacter sp.]